MSLVSPKRMLEPRYDAVVIGSGYGGGVAALRLAEAGLSVCVLERGLEHRPEDFAERTAEILPQVQARIDLHGRSRRVGSHLGLFDLRVHEDVSVLVGCGVGGTSLINANVFAAADPGVFATGWPAALREDDEGRRAAFARAEDVLRPAPHAGPVAKEKVLDRLAGALGTRAKRLPLLVDAPPCNGCGNCVSGCRRGAKRTVDRTYLAEAVSLGASIFAEMEVHHVVRVGARWAVHYAPVCRAISETEALPFILADRVYLAAGALGSTEILLRSRAAGLAVSDALGTRFSANGNGMGVVDGDAVDVRAMGAAENGPGPCITSAFETGSPESPIHVEDGTAPRLLGTLARATALLERTRVSVRERSPARIAKDLAATFLEGHFDADERALIVLTQCDDGAAGRVVLGKDGAVVDWPGYGSAVAHVDRALERGAKLANAKYRALRPSWFGVAGHMTVHPLGGCPVGEDSITGVVDHTGAVFDASASDVQAVHQGLYVCDGAVIPRAIGKNPAATITMLAERALALHLAAQPRRVTAQSRPAIRPRGEAFVLAEAFDGWLTTDESEGPLSYPLHAHFTIEIDDLKRWRRDPDHGASVTGTLASPFFGKHVASVVRGQVFLLTDDPLDKDVFYNTYRLGLIHPYGEELLLEGMKVWRGNDPFSLWGDGTQMPIELSRGKGASIAKGFLRMSARQFAGSMRSYWGKSERTVLADLGARARFASFSLGRIGERLRARR